MLAASRAGTLAASTVAAQFASVALYWVAARYVDPAEFGLFLASYGVAVLIVVSSDLGLSGLSVRELARDSLQAETYRSAFWAKSAIAFGSVALWSVGVLLIPDARARLPVEILAVYILAGMMTSSLLVPLRASQKMHLVGVATVIEKAFALLIGYAGFRLWGAKPEVLPLAMAGGAIGALGATIIMLPAPFRKLGSPSRVRMVTVLRQSVHFALANVASQLQRLDVTVVLLVAGTQVAGVFGVPARISAAMGSLPNSLSWAMLPAAVESAVPEARRQAVVGVGALVLAFVLLFAFGILFADSLVPILLGPKYSAAIPVMRIYLLGMILTVINQPRAAWLQGAGQDRLVAAAVLSASVCGLVAIAVGARAYGAVGAAFGVIVLQVVAGLGLWIPWPHGRRGQPLAGARHVNDA